MHTQVVGFLSSLLQILVNEGSVDSENVESMCLCFLLHGEDSLFNPH